MKSRIGPFLACVCWLALTGCGARAPETRTPDESSDLLAPSLVAAAIEEPKSSFLSDGTRPAGAELDGTVWNFSSAQCTEGPLDLAARGFAQTLTVRAVGQDLVLTYDQAFEKEGCAQTIVQRATRSADGGYQIAEETRVAVPTTDACQGVLQDARPGEIRHHGDGLEIVVQRSKDWCNGFDVLLSYEKGSPSLLDDATVLRHFVTFMNRRDAVAVSQLYAEHGSLLDPYLQLDTGGASRVDGRAAIQRWYTRAFQGVPWTAMRIRGISPGAAQNVVMLSWEYIDPRLEAPLVGETRFVMAAGEIFESEARVKDGKPRTEGTDAAAPAPTAKTP